jgi:hypothetical protein
MENNVKTWEVTYKHPFTGELRKALVYGKSKKEAGKKARENNVPTRGKTFFWEIVSIEELRMN